MTNLTQAEIERFWKCCGWKFCEQDDHEGVYIEPFWESPSSEAHDSLPNPSDLNAVMEGLEWFCKQRRLYFELRQTASGFNVDLDKYEGSRLGGVRGSTKNEAIIRAVLAAADSTGEKEEG